MYQPFIQRGGGTLNESWKPFVVGKLFPSIIKPTVYHSHELEEDINGIPYVVRSKFNNGIKCRVKKLETISISPAGVISFGAENASFFYQPEEWCSGRDIYYIDTRHISKNACLFVASCLQKVTSKYGYNYGLFPDLLKCETIQLPVDSLGAPNWTQMESFIDRISDRAKNLMKNLS